MITYLYNDMKRIHLLLGILAITLFACKKEPSVNLDGVPESVVKLTENDNCTCDPQINLFRWDGRLLYVYMISGPACDGFPVFFDEEGNRVELTNEEIRTFLEEAERVKTIWKCGE